MTKDEALKASIDELANEYLRAKKEKDNIQEYMDNLMYIISSKTGVNENTDYEGNQTLEGEKYKVCVKYSLNYNVNKEKADEVIKTLECKAEDVFNVKYSFSKTKSKNLSEEDKSLLMEAMESKRAKTSLEIKQKEN